MKNIRSVLLIISIPVIILAIVIIENFDFSNPEVSVNEIPMENTPVSNQQSAEETRIYSDAEAFFNEFNKQYRKHSIETTATYEIIREGDSRALQVKFGYNDQMTGVLNADNSLHDLVYKQEFPYYTQESIDAMEEAGVEGDQGVEIYFAMDAILSTFSPDASESEVSQVMAMFDRTPRVNPGVASTSTVKIGEISYNFHISEDGICSFRVSGISN